jgi:hypothetical protein
MQRTEVPIPDAPDSLAIVSVDADSAGYTQHYYDGAWEKSVNGTTWEHDFTLTYRGIR